MDGQRHGKTVSTEPDDELAEAEEERRAIIERHARPWMIAAYVLAALGVAVMLLGPHVALDGYSPLRLGAVLISLAATACVLSLVSFRYPESRQGIAFRKVIAMVCGFAVTGPLLWYAGLFDANLFVLGTQAVAGWLTQWQGGWGQSFVAGFLSLLPAFPAIALFDYLFSGSAISHRWLDSIFPQREKRPTDYRSAAGAVPSSSAGGMKNLAKVVIIFGILAALFVGLIAFVGIADNMSRNFGAGVIALAICAGVLVAAGGLLLRNSK
jgi:hypothetical protein